MQNNMEKKMNELVNLSKLGHVGEDIVSFMSINGIDCSDTLLKRTAIDYYLQYNGIVGFTPDIERILNSNGEEMDNINFEENGEKMNTVNVNTELENIKNCKNFNDIFDTMFKLDKKISDNLNIKHINLFNSCVFDEISINKENNSVSCLSLFYIDLDEEISFIDFFQSKTNMNSLRKDYNQLNEKLSNSFETDEGYLNFQYEELDVLKNIFLEHLPNILKKLNEFIILLNEFNEINFQLISDSGIKSEGLSNGARFQEILFSVKNTIYKISINSESYKKQSYARLYEKGDEWIHLISMTPPDIAYQENFKSNEFKNIINAFFRKAIMIKNIESSC